MVFARFAHIDSAVSSDKPSISKTISPAKPVLGCHIGGSWRLRSSPLWKIAQYTPVRLLSLYVALCILFAASCLGQFASTPQPGLPEAGTYQHSDVDSVNLSNGNVYLHIPLVSFPQVGHSLKLNFNLRFNSPGWAVTPTNVQTPWNTGTPLYTGNWYLNNNQILNTNNQADYNTPRPVGVDVVRDQGITTNNIGMSYMCVANDGTGPADCGTGEPEYVFDYSGQDGLGVYYSQALMTNVRDRTGAEHTVALSALTGFPVGATSSAPDGSGWIPVANAGTPNTFVDREGTLYTPKTITNASGQFIGFAHDLKDTNGNTITTSLNGWTDSTGRNIPGSYSGAGSGFAVPSASQTPFEDDPFPGVPSNDLSKCASGASAAREWTVPWTPNNTTSSGSATYIFCYTPQQASTQFNATKLNHYDANIVEGTASGLLLTQVILPNNTSYQFTYDGYFNLNSITLPTGGTISYVWTNIAWDANSLSQPVTRAISSRTVTASSGQSQTWYYDWLTASPANPSTGIGSPGNVDVAVKISKPDGNDEIHATYSAASGGQSTTIYFQGRTSTPTWATVLSPTNFLRSEVTQHQVLPSPFFEPLPQLPPQQNGDTPADGVYSAPWTFQELYIGQPLSTTVTLDNGAVSQTVYTPLPASTITYKNPGLNRFWENDQSKSETCLCLQYGLLSSTAEYDYGTPGSGAAGPLLRTTTTTYHWNDGTSNSASYLAANLLDLPSSTVVTAPSGSTAAETDYGYDESPSPSGALGNLTSVTHVNNAGASPKTQTQYNSQGMPTLKIDADNNQTSIASYQCSGLFPQQVITAYQSSTTLPETTSYVYDCNLGRLVSSTDANNQATTYLYNDPLARLTETQYPDGGDVQFKYNDTPSSLMMTKTTTTSATTLPVVTNVLYDGLGRAVQTQVASDPVAPILQDTTYDPVGRVASTSNPYRSLTEGTYGITSYNYDGLGRMRYQCQPDNGSNTPCQPGTSYLKWMYSGNTTSSYDEIGNYRSQTADALGRLTKVLEPDGTQAVGAAPTLETDYTYDSLGNLWNVLQKGAASDAPRGRSFTYDSLSRLLCASNPENSQAACPASATASIPAGVVGYSYDPNGNVSSKTDARGVTTNYTYDALNRLTLKTYSGIASIAGTTPQSSYSYDSASVPNAVGRLTSEFTGPASSPVTQRSIISYDQMGRVKQETQCATAAGCAGTPYGLQYQYNLRGDVVYSNNGSPNMGIGFTYGYDGSGRLQTVSSTWSDPSHPAQLFGPPSVEAQYGPSGLNAANLGAQSVGSESLYTQARSYDNRLRLVSETDLVNSLNVAAMASTGTIVIAGTEQQKSTPATPGTGTITVTGTEGYINLCTTKKGGAKTVTTCTQGWDTGSLTVQVGSFAASADYGNGSSDPTVASALASAFNASGSPVTASATGNVVTVTSIATGTAGNYTYSVTNGGDFTGTTSGSALTGGASGGPVYDAGTVTATISGTPASYSWSGGSTAASIATGLAAAINQADGSTLQATASGATINLTSLQAGSAGNTAISCSVSYNNAQFTSSSFSTSCNGMTGGTTASTAGSSSTGSINVSSSATQSLSGTFNIYGQDGIDYLQSYDYGVIQLNVGYEAASVNYGQYSTPENLASQLAAGLNTYPNIHATVTGSTISVVASLASTADSSFYGTVLSSDLQINVPSFIVNATGLQSNDAGSVTVTINGVTTAPVAWSPGSTAQQIASGLVGAINTADSSFLAASLAPSGTSINLTSVATGGGTDWPIQIAATDTAGISPASFSFTANNMSGGQGPNSTTMYSYSIPASGGYAANGNLLAVNDSVMGSWTYNYDNLNRLLTAQAAPNAQTGFNPYGTALLTWGYDSFGNNKGHQLTGNTSATATQAVYTYTGYSLLNGVSRNGVATNQMDNYNYDAAGDLLSDNINNYGYDAEGRVSSVNGNVQYLYDAEGRRVAKGSVNGSATVLTEQYLLGLGGEQVSELDGQGNWKLSNVYAAGKLLATYNPAGLHFHFTDWLGTRRVQGSGAGVIEETCQSFPFGDSLNCAGSDATPLHFTSKQRDSESGLDFFGARYYGSSMGRFMSPDYNKSGDDPEPVPYADLENPQSLNLYEYAGNNPLIHIDADGHCWPQWLCNFAVEVKNEVFHGEFTTDTSAAKIHQLVREDAQNRAKSLYMEQLKSHPPEIRYGVVFTPFTSQFLGQLGERTTYLYEKVGPNGEHLKYGITSNDPSKRYSASELKGGRLKTLAKGSRSDMLKMERDLHETMPIGPEEGQSFYEGIQEGKGLSTPPYDPLP